MPLPESIGIIPDGNRRFAKRLMARPWKGHEWGIQKIEQISEWAQEAGVNAITFYALSLENLQKRPKRELAYIYKLIGAAIDRYLEPGSKVHRDRTRVRFFGRLDLVPAPLRAKARAIERATAGYKGPLMQIALAYGGRQELVEAARAMARKAKAGTLNPDSIDEAVLRHHLQTNGARDPDLILRTGGDQRLSNFLLYQGAYSELAFIPVFWPELTKRQFMTALRSYERRDRRFGK